MKVRQLTKEAKCCYNLSLLFSHQSNKSGCTQAMYTGKKQVICTNNRMIINKFVSPIAAGIPWREVPVVVARGHPTHDLGRIPRQMGWLDHAELSHIKRSPSHHDQWQNMNMALQETTSP